MNTKKWIITVISILLMFCGRFVPPLFGLTSLGMQVAGIFIGTILLWMFVSVTWPSILCIIALILTPLYTYSTALSGSMGGYITSFVLFSSMVTYALRQTGFLKRIAIWFVTRPWAQKNPLDLPWTALPGPAGHRLLHVPDPGLHRLPADRRADLQRTPL